MKFFLSCVAAVCLASALHAAEPKTPPPPELQALAETLVNAIKTQDDAAIVACWHSPEVMAKRKEAEALTASGTSPTEVDVAKERERELKRREKDMTISKHRISEIRALITKHFGDLAGLKLAELEVDPEEDAVDPEAELDGVEFHLLAADGTKLCMEVDDAIRIEGVWKFKGRIESKLSIELSDP